MLEQRAHQKPNVTESATIVGDVADLRALCLVTDLASVTAAARVLGESKATVSRRISRLEAALGVTLVERTSRRVRATEDGVAYRERIGEVLDRLGAANDAARHAKAAPSGKLRVTSGPEFNSVFAPLVVAFRERYPEVDVEMVVTQAAVDLDRENVDVALRVSFQLPDSALVAHKLRRLGVVAVASPAYVRAHGTLRRPSDLERHPIAFVSSRTLTQVPFHHRKTGRTTNVAIRPTFLASDMNFVVEVALAGGAVACLPELAVRRELASGTLVNLLPDYDVAGAWLYLMHRSARYLPPKVRAFRDFVVAALRERSEAV